MIAAAPLLPERGDDRGDGALVTDQLGGQHEEGGVVAVGPVLLAARVGRAEVVERDLTLVAHQDAESVEVAVRDPGVVQRDRAASTRRRARRR